MLVQREDPRGDGFRKKKKKDFNEAEEIASCNMDARKQSSYINFHGGLIDLFIAYVRDFYTVVEWRAKVVEYTTLLIFPHSLNDF